METLTSRIWTVEDFFTAEECKRLITESEGGGYVAATVFQPGGRSVTSQMRNNSRLAVEDGKLASEILSRATPHFPSFLEGVALCGLNPEFRYYRYDPGEQFKIHYDWPTKLPNQESKLTFMVYLNDGFEGGETAFYYDDRTPNIVISPKIGMALIFEHHQLHEGLPVVSGRKYVIRTDVMFVAAA